MPAIVVQGAVWGDEGKGKIVDLLAQDADVVVRFHGANNAGHSFVLNGKKIVLHLLSAGAIHKGKLAVCLPYEGMDLGVLVGELEIARTNKSDVVIDRRCPIILPVHIDIDRGREASKGKDKIGTTCRGIGPMYEDFHSRRYVSMGDLADGADKLTAKLKLGGYYQERCDVACFHGEDPLSLTACVEYLMQFRDRIRDNVGDAACIVTSRYRKGDNILFEGAQAIMLDVLNGTQPFVTSSFCSPYAALMQCGINRFDRNISVVKAYTTRVGAGPFPSELHGNEGDEIRVAGGEYGATTGRPRRCGWLNIQQVNYGLGLTGATELAVTKLDVLSGKRKIKMGIAYEEVVDGVEHAVNRDVTLTTSLLERVKPQFQEFDGWDEDISTCKDFDTLPKNAQKYIEGIEEATSLPVTLIGVSPERNGTIQR